MESSGLVRVFESLRVDLRDPSPSRGRWVTVGVTQKHVLNFKSGGKSEETRVGARDGGSHFPKLLDLIGKFNALRILIIVLSKSVETC